MVAKGGEDLTIKSGERPRHYQKTPEEEMKIIRRVLKKEIINVRGGCVKFGQMGSKVCRRHAEKMGWHKGGWGKGWAFMTDEEKRFNERRKNREYYQKHRTRIRAYYKKWNAIKREEERGWTGRAGMR